MQDRPALFSTFLLWLLGDLFEDLPEVGDPDKPKLVFFFDEAHLLFADASKAFLEAITRTVRLIRSKGVGVFFVTQQPTDVPDDVLAQLGNRVQHALRAFTPDDADALRKTVRTYPKTADYELEETLTSLGTGEAVVTVMSERGVPTPVAWTRAARAAVTDGAGRPGGGRAGGGGVAAAGRVRRRGGPGVGVRASRRPARPAAGRPPAPEVPPTPQAPPRDEADEPDEPGVGGFLGKMLGSSAARSFARSAATVLGREITRGVLGTARRRSRSTRRR